MGAANDGDLVLFLPDDVPGVDHRRGGGHLPRGLPAAVPLHPESVPTLDDDAGCAVVNVMRALGR